MADPDRIRIKPLDEKGDYSLWKIRIESACKSKTLSEVLTSETHTGSATEAEKFADKQSQASNIIIGALTDAPLRVVRTVIGNPYRMLAKLDARYDSKSTASRISRMSELVSLRYSTLKQDITKHIDKMSSLIVQLQNMGTNIEDALAVGILVASIEAPQLLPVTAAIKTLSVVHILGIRHARLIEDYSILRANVGTKDRAAVGVAGKHCEICHKRNHITADCFLNPRNPKNKLNLLKEPSTDNDSATGKRSPSDSRKPTRDAKIRKDQQRAATARAAVTKTAREDLMMLDLGTTAHMTPDVRYLQDTKRCNVPIALGDDSTVQATHKGTRPVLWQSRENNTKVSLSNTLAAPDLAMSLISIPALTEKGICVLFMPEKALMIDSHDNYTIIGQAHKAEDGLFYISDRRSKSEMYETDEDRESLRAMMAIVKSADEDSTSQSDDDVPDDMPPLLSFDEDSDSDWEADHTSSDDCDGYDTDEDTDEDTLQATDTDDSVDLQNVDNQPEITANDSNDVTATVEEDPRTISRCSSKLIGTWHTRLGHTASTGKIKEMITSGIEFRKNFFQLQDAIPAHARIARRGSIAKATVEA